MLTLTLAALLMGGCEQNSNTLGNTSKELSETEKVCKRAYGSTEAKRKKIATERGIKVEDLPPMPAEDKFVETCGKFPIEAARCLDVVYYASDPTACNAEIEKVPEADRKAIEELNKAAGDEKAEAKKDGEGAAEGEAKSAGEAAMEAGAGE